MDHKASHRQSRAPWLTSAKAQKSSNPYANANTSVLSPNDMKVRNRANTGGGLKVPNPYGAGSNVQNRKNSRRLSIHAMAMQNGKSGAPPFDLQNLPPVPSLNKTVTQNSDNALIAESIQEERGEFDEIEATILNKLSNGTAGEIDDHYKFLVKKKALVTRDIKENINENQKNILELTHDLKSTQEELMKLRVTTKDLYEVFNEFRESARRRLDLELEPQNNSANTSYENAPSSLKIPKKRKDRSSVLVLQKMWATELQSLFKHVEGASKFIQAIPGRHVLAESGRWLEVNVGTWKTTKAIHLFILNDLMLIATKKSSSGQDSGTSGKKLQAILCWPLQEIKLSEIQVPQPVNSGKEENKAYAINVRSKSLSYVYRTDRYDHFLKIMDAYTKGSNEILQKNRLLDARKSINQSTDGSETTDEKRQLRESLRGSGFMELSNIDDSSQTRTNSIKRQSADILLQDISARVHSRNRSHDFGKGFNPNTATGDKSKFFIDLKSIEDKLDEVDVHIAHNKFYESVGLINHIEGKLNSIESSISRGKNNGIEEEIKLLIDVIKLKIGNRKLKVQQYLNFDLQQNIAKLSNGEISQIIEFYQNFDQLDEGISSYLQAMSSYLSSTIAKLVVGVQGSTRIDIVNYLSNLVIIHVSIIKRAITVYNQCIKPIIKRHKQQDVDSSGFISWCIDEVAKLVLSVKKHLYGTLITVTSDPESDEKIYKIKDPQYFQEFLDVIRPQLNDLKSVGVNVDFLFDDILSLQE